MTTRWWLRKRERSASSPSENQIVHLLSVLTEFLNQLIFGIVLKDSNLIHVTLTGKMNGCCLHIDQDQTDNRVPNIVTSKFAVQIIVSKQKKKALHRVCWSAGRNCIKLFQWKIDDVIRWCFSSLMLEWFDSIAQLEEIRSIVVASIGARESGVVKTLVGSEMIFITCSLEFEPFDWQGWWCPRPATVFDDPWSNSSDWRRDPVNRFSSSRFEQRGKPRITRRAREPLSDAWSAISYG